MFYKKGLTIFIGWIIKSGWFFLSIASLSDSKLRAFCLDL
jgi:hypothetical protein